jgi:hypothetical protein
MRGAIGLGELLVVVAVSRPRRGADSADQDRHSQRAVPQQHHEEHPEREHPSRRQRLIHGARKLGILPARRLVQEGVWAGGRIPGRTEGWQASGRLV